MNIEQLRSITTNPAATQREREGARERLTALAPESTSDDALLSELLSATGAARLAEVSSPQMLEFSRSKGNAESVLRMDRVRSAMITREFWERYIASTGKRREETNELIKLLYGINAEPERLSLAARELDEARCTLESLESAKV